MTYYLDGIERSPFSRCGMCDHFRGRIQKEGWARGIEVCDAFPEGIPDDIWEEKVIHDKPYPGDHGILFEHKNDVSFKPSSDSPKE